MMGVRDWSGLEEVREREKEWIGRRDNTDYIRQSIQNTRYVLVIIEREEKRKRKITEVQKKRQKTAAVGNRLLGAKRIGDEPVDSPSYIILQSTSTSTEYRYKYRVQSTSRKMPH
jgi:hypothetical protein